MIKNSLTGQLTSLLEINCFTSPEKFFGSNFRYEVEGPVIPTPGLKFLESLD